MTTLTEFFQLSPSMMHIAGFDGFLKIVNPSLVNMLGYTEKEILETPLYQFVVEEDRKPVEEEIEKLSKGQLVTAFHCRILSKSGKAIWTVWTATPNDKRTHFFAIGNDITREKSIELEHLRQIAAAQKEISQIYEAIDKAAIVAITDLQGKIRYANSTFCEISGYSREELVGQNHRILNSGFHPKTFFDQMWRTISNGQIWKGEIRNKRKDGTYYWVQTTIVPLRNLQGKTIEYLSIRFDITAMKNAQESLGQKAKLSSLGEMAAGIAHEINNPLTIIHGKASQLRKLLGENTQSDQQAIIDAITKIENTAMRISNIVKGLRSFSHSDEKETMHPVSIDTVVEDTLSLCQSRFRNHGIELSTHMEKPFPVIYCRAGQISQVLMNLLNNAFDSIEAMQERWIKLSVEKKVDVIEISVTDSGKGIPEKLRDRIMDPFFTTKEVGKGTGLGLSISSGIAKLHGGNLLLDTECPNTRFVLKLPIK